MIDLFCIFTTGGLILWYKTFVSMKFEGLINNLIKNILMDEKRNQEYYIQSGNVIRWKVVNDSGLIFVVSYQETYSILYVDRLIDLVVKDFLNNYQGKLKKIGNVYTDKPDYNGTFMKLLKIWEQYCQDKREYDNIYL